MSRLVYSVSRVPRAALAVLAFLLLAAAFQTRPPVTLNMDSPGEDRYLAGFYAPEVTAGVTHRWSDGAGRIVLRGLGRGATMQLRINLQAIRPASIPIPAITIMLNERFSLARFTPGPDLAAYNFDVLPDAIDLRGDLVIDLLSDTFVPKESGLGEDARTLGVFVDRVVVEFGSGLIAPPLMVWALLIVCPLAVYSLGRAWGWSKRVSFGLGLLLLLAEAGGVVIARAWTGYNAPWLLATVGSLYLLTVRLQRADRISASTPNHQALHPIATRQLLDVTFKFILPAFLIWRLALIVIPLAGSSIVGVRECCPPIDPVPVQSLHQAAFGHWNRWDAIWYGSIAQAGYQYFGEHEASNVGFFPLYPMLIGATMRLTGLPFDVAGPLVSTALAFVACALLYRLVARETDDADAALRSVVYLLAFPAAYYLAIGYSEALYVLCVLAAFGWAREGRWGLSGVAAFLAGLTRLHGALLIAPLGYEYLRQRRFRLRDVRLARPRPPSARDALGALGGLLGVLAFNLYLIFQFGKPDGYLSPYFQIQALFFKGIRAEAFPTFPTTTLANYLNGLLNNFPTTEGVIVVSAMILLLILTLETWLRLPRVYGVYMLTVALFSLIGGDLISMPRFVVPMFPGFVALALIGRSPQADRAILILSATLQGVLALLFANGYWIA